MERSRIGRTSRPSPRSSDIMPPAGGDKGLWPKKAWSASSDACPRTVGKPPLQAPDDRSRIGLLLGLDGVIAFEFVSVPVLVLKVFAGIGCASPSDE